MSLSGVKQVPKEWKEWGFLRGQLARFHNVSLSTLTIASQKAGHGYAVETFSQSQNVRSCCFGCNCNSLVWSNEEGVARKRSLGEKKKRTSKTGASVRTLIFVSMFVQHLCFGCV